MMGQMDSFTKNGAVAGRVTGAEGKKHEVAARLRQTGGVSTARALEINGTWWPTVFVSPRPARLELRKRISWRTISSVLLPGAAPGILLGAQRDSDLDPAIIGRQEVPVGEALLADVVHAIADSNIPELSLDLRNGRRELTRWRKPSSGPLSCPPVPFRLQ